MKCLLLFLLAVLTLPARADDTMKARAALALASSKPVLSAAEASARAALALAPHRPGTLDLTKPLTMEQGQRIAREQPGRVIMVSVGIDCTALCSHLRPEIPTAHAADFCGDTTAQLRLITADQTGTMWMQERPWRSLPAEAEVRAMADYLRRCVAAGCTCTDGCRCADKDDCPGRCPTSGTRLYLPAGCVPGRGCEGAACSPFAGSAPAFAPAMFPSASSCPNGRCPRR